MAKVNQLDVDSRTAKDPHFANEVRKAMESLQQILLTLNFKDNFRGYQWEGSIAASTEISVAHRLGVVPSGYIVTYCQGGTIQAGNAAWTNTHFTLRNISGATTAVGKVFIFV